MAAITIDLPDTILNDLGKSPGEVRRLLGLSWQETEDFLARHGLPYQYTADDLNEDRQNLDRVLGHN